MKWPDEGVLPGFKETFVRYAQSMQKLSGELLALAAEAFELPRDAFSRFFEPDGNQDRAKLVKYPVPEDDSSNQGVGPHYDGGFLTLVRLFVQLVQTKRNQLTSAYQVTASVTTSRPAGTECLRRVDRCSAYFRNLRCEHRQRCNTLLSVPEMHVGYSHQQLLLRST